MIRALLALLLAVSVPSDPVGDVMYMTCPGLILDAIRRAEGVPSYGILYLAQRFGGHRRVPESEGRLAAARLLHQTHARWIVATGRRSPFLPFLQQTWAPIPASNDPGGLNRHWLSNVGRYLASHVCR